VIATLFGLAVGSFLNVVIYRVPLGMSVSRPRSQCTKCGSAIRWQHNIPVVGWLMLHGRCYDCAARISARYPAVEAITGLAFGFATFALLSTS
jgi:leader peptidase (prepilin peptidase)/N-methyltransferase